MVLLNENENKEASPKPEEGIMWNMNAEGILVP